jgi:hypothetical protein
MSIVTSSTNRRTPRDTLHSCLITQKGLVVDSENFGLCNNENNRGMVGKSTKKLSLEEEL